jgi:hypothetical protein
MRLCAVFRATFRDVDVDVDVEAELVVVAFDLGLALDLLAVEGGLAGVSAAAAGFIWMIFRARVGGGGSVMSAAACGCGCDVLRFLERAMEASAALAASAFCSTSAGGGSVKVSMELD